MASRGGQSVAHVMRVKKLYRHGLKLLMNWTVHRDLWIQKGTELRAQFEANRSVQGQMNIERLVRAGEQKLKEHAHPDPYKLPTSFGGTKYQRYPNNNKGFGPDICAIPSYIR